MILRYDENFNIKANKTEFFELREQKLDKELLEPVRIEMKELNENQVLEMDKLKANLELMQE